MAFTSNITWIQAGERVTGSDSPLDNNGVLNRPSVQLLANTVDNKNRIDVIENSIDDIISNPGSPIVHNHNTVHSNLQGGDNSDVDNANWEYYHVTQDQFGYLQDANQPGGVLLIDGGGKVDRQRIALYNFINKQSQNPAAVPQDTWTAYTFDSFFAGIAAETGIFISFFHVYFNPTVVGNFCYFRNPLPDSSDPSLPSLNDPFIRSETSNGSCCTLTMIARRNAGSDPVLRFYSSIEITAQDQLIITSVGTFKISA